MQSVNTSQLFSVTPYAGVWIEISDMFDKIHEHLSHSLRGSVD